METSASPSSRPTDSSWWRGTVIALVILAVGLAIGCFAMGETGPLWPDSPRYANGAAMILDWLRSGDYHSPKAFALRNYAQYPSFSIPYHPPGYPLVLAIWFGVTGPSYASARLFIAVCWAATGGLFYLIHRHFGAGRTSSAAVALLLLTTPPLAIWARDTMSEVPSLVPLLAATLFYVRWLDGGRAWNAALAGLLLETAFFFRVTTSAVVPGLVLYGMLTRGLTRRKLLCVALFGVVYLSVNAGYITFAAQYSRHEVSADGKDQGLGFAQAIQYFRVCSPGLVAGGTAAVGFGGLLAALIGRSVHRPVLLWAAWLASCVAFKIAVPTTTEVRHLVLAMPALAGLAVAWFPDRDSSRYQRRLALAAALSTLAVAFNLFVLARTTPRGLVGYAPVAEALAKADGPGHIFMACPEDQELMFRYRVAHPARDRDCVRSDRSLVVRVSEYAHQTDDVRATTQDDVLDVFRRGRIGYVVTCQPYPGRRDVRPVDYKLTEQTVRARPEMFREIKSFPLLVDYVDGAHRDTQGLVTIWQVTAHVEDGPPDLPVLVPTASLRIEP
ncbi:ArnT family glycosyltransferase [Planctomyces sp. SH-PL62]|uniref:ArnT family glycosyltransferase n=1 Tax=Planctomyces sp. SH-PL62 TaxID=1636152 RepID=UPI0018D3C85D|nr:glycosyltransferase family 39 protein [Planctomyces sp. SH-PL62]